MAPVCCPVTHKWSTGWSWITEGAHTTTTNRREGGGGTSRAVERLRRDATIIDTNTTSIIHGRTSRMAGSGERLLCIMNMPSSGHWSMQCFASVLQTLRIRNNDAVNLRLTTTPASPASHQYQNTRRTQRRHDERRALVLLTGAEPGTAWTEHNFNCDLTGEPLRSR